MTSRGLAFYIALRQNTRAGDTRVGAGSDVPAISARVEPRASRRRVRKLGTALAASLTVFVKLLRRPLGGTVVVLVPREGVPDGSGTVVVSAEWLPRAS
jgi:hypothetical protein